MAHTDDAYGAMLLTMALSANKEEYARPLSTPEFRRFEAAVREVPGVRVHGGHGGVGRTGVVALNIADADSALVADLLNADFGICTRAGAHCAPLMHEALGTSRQGAVRFSFSHLNTADEVDFGADAVSQIAKELA